MLPSSRWREISLEYVVAKKPYRQFVRSYNTLTLCEVTVVTEDSSTNTGDSSVSNETENSTSGC